MLPTIAQNITVSPRNPSNQRIEKVTVSPSGKLMAVLTREYNSIKVLDAFDGAFLYNYPINERVEGVYFTNETTLLLIYKFKMELLDIMNHQVLDSINLQEVIVSTDFNLDNKVLAITSLNSVKTFSCYNLKFAPMGSREAPYCNQVSISLDGRFFAIQEKQKVNIYHTRNMKLEGSVSIENLKSFILTKNYLVTLSSNPFSYHYFTFDGNTLGSSHEFKNLNEPNLFSLVSSENFLLMKTYNKLVLAANDGSQTILGTDNSYYGLFYSVKSKRFVIWSKDAIRIIDQEGMIHQEITASQLDYEIYDDDLASSKSIYLSSNRMKFSDAKSSHEYNITESSANRIFNSENWLAILKSNAILEIRDIKQEQIIYTLQLPWLPSSILIDEKNRGVIVADNMDSTLNYYSLTDGSKRLLIKDSSRITSLAYDGTNLYWGNNLGDITLSKLNENGFKILNKVNVFGDGISKIMCLDASLLIASYGRMVEVKKDLSDVTNPFMMVGHNGYIHDLCLLPNRQFILSCALDHTVKLWDLQTHRLIQSYDLDTLQALHLRAPSNSQFWFYGANFARGSITDSAIISKTLQPKLELVVQSPNSTSPLKLVINPDGTLLATVDNNTVKVRDLKSGFLLSEFSTSSKVVNGITFTAKGNSLAVASANEVSLFDPYSGKIIRNIDLRNRGRSIHDVEAYQNAIVALNIHGWHNPLILHKNSGLYLGDIFYYSEAEPDKYLLDFKCTQDGSRLVTYGSNYLKVFDLNQNHLFSIRLAGKGKTNLNVVDVMSLSYDGKYILFNDFDEYSNLKIANLNTGEILKEHRGGIGAIGKDGNYIYVIGDKRLGMRNIFNDSSRVLDISFDGIINNLVYNAAAEIFAVSDNWGNIKILEGRSGSVLSEINRWDQYTYNVIAANDGNRLLFNNRSGLYTIDLSNLERESIPADNYPLSGVFSPNSDQLFYRKKTTIYSKTFSNGKIDSLFELKLLAKEIKAMNISNDAKLLYFTNADDDIIVYEIISGKEILRFNKFKIKGMDGLVVHDIISAIEGYEIKGIAIYNHGNESGFRQVRLTMNEQMPIAFQSPEIRLTRESKDGFDALRFKLDAKIMSITEDEKYLVYMKKLELYIVDIKTGDTIFNRDNPVMGSITQACFTPNQKHFIIGFEDGTIEVYNFQKQGRQYKYGNESYGLYRETVFKANTNGIESMAVSGAWLIVKGTNAFTTLFDIEHGWQKVLDMDFIKDEDQIFINASNYYFTTKNALNYIALKKDQSIFPIGQLDIKLNRPDKVLESIHSTDTMLIRSYKNAYGKRLQKLKIDTNTLSNTLALPIAEFKNKSSLPYNQVRPDLQLTLNTSDSSAFIDRVNIWINQVPIWGMNGLSIKSRKLHSFDTTITLTLSNGINQIECATTNTHGSESNHTPISISYTPTKKTIPKVYFVGIGIDQFANPKYNLRYSCKDIRDLCEKLHEKYGEQLIIDTLFNKQVSVSNINALRAKLLTTSVDDKVIISYSGHGLLDRKYNYFLSTFDVDFEHPELKGLSYESMEHLLDSIPARKKLLLIDACHSGEVDKDDVSAMNQKSDSMGLAKGSQILEYSNEHSFGLRNSFELMQNVFVNVGQNTGAIIISAAAGNQYALENGDLQNGVFTYTILEALNQYQTIKIGALRKTVSDRVSQLTNGLQKPTFRNETMAVDWDVW